MEKIGEDSQAKAAKVLKITPTALSRYLNGERTMDEFTCIMVAKILGIDGMEIIAAAQMEREKDEERREIWADFRKKFDAKVGIVGLSLALALGSLTPDKAMANSAYVERNAHDISILCQILYVPFVSKPDAYW
ncbi:hypothetical protein BKX93_02865 [Chromobacterium vaccinii]|uniref:HTH cro/C1-type domain-containing protein n=2 Tax=Chromobacterium vaccinii TaxID=1108595 RepID=A0A1D9LCN7_9NEIS|nr:hypothetical protein BKX93_02865 [Chromobacterium vaccinii]